MPRQLMEENGGKTVEVPVSGKPVAKAAVRHFDQANVPEARSRVAET